MATNNRDVKLTLGVQTTGAEEIDKLKLAVEKLAKEGGDAAPEFQQLADEIDRMGQQAAALRTFEELARATDELKVSQQAAKTTTEELGAQLVTLGNVTERAKREQEGAAQNAREAQASYKALKDELQILRSTYDANGDRAANYKAKVEELTRAKIAAKNAFDTANQSLRETNAAVREAEQAEANLQTRYAQSERSLNNVNTALRERSTALDGARTAADQLGVATDNVASAQVALVTSLNQVGTAADQVRLKKIAETRALEQSVVALKAAQDAADATAKASADAARALQSAFGTIGTRSAQELEVEIRQVRAAMDAVRTGAGLTGNELAAAMASGNARVAELERGLREVRGELTLADKAADLFKNSMGQIAAGNLIADGIGALVEKVKDLGRQFITTIVETEQLRRGLNAVYKDTAVAGAQFEFLRKTAQDSGQAVGTLGASFLRFSAATQSANIPLSVTNDLFATVTRVAGSLGLSAEATGGTLDALGQIASKGVVSLEELRQQLGDRLPGALSAAAKGLGLTDAELIKLVESGNLAARDFFPAFSQGLKTLQGDTEGLVPTFNRLKNAFTTAAQALGDAGALEILTAGLRAIAAAAGAVLIPIQLVFDAFFSLVRATAALTAAFVSGGNAIENLKDIWNSLVNRQTAVIKSFGDVVLGADKVATTTVNLASATAAAATAAQQAGADWATLSRSQQVSAVAAVIAADSQRDLSARLVQTTAAINVALAAQEKESESLAKLAKATQDQNAGLISLARLRGDEAAALAVSAQAANENAAALAKLAVSQAEETKLLEMKRDLLVRTREAQGENTDQIAKQTVELEKQIQVSRAAQVQAESAAEASRLEAVAKQQAANAYADNAEKVALYRDRLARANEILAITTQLERAGAVGKEELRRATEEVAIAQARYSDALKDSSAQIQLETKSRLAGLQIAKESLSAEVALLQAKAEQARNSGLLVTAIDLEREAKRKQIEVDRLLIDIKEVELQLLREELRAKLELLQLEEPGNELKRKELELRLRLTEVQAKQIESSRELLKIKEEENTRTELLSRNIGGEADARDRNTAAAGRETGARITSTNAVIGHSDAMEKLLMQYTLSADYSERQIAMLEREAAAAEKAAEAKRKYWNVDKDGFTLDNTGQRMQQSVPTDRYVLDAAKSQGLTEAQALELVDRFIRNGEGVGMINGMDWFSSVNKAISDLVVESARKRVRDQDPNGRGQTGRPGGTGGTAGAGGGTPSAGAGSGAAVSSGMTINVNIGGRVTPIGVRSQADADQLASIFRTLEDASRRSS